jgi:hypothetical protein
MAQQRTAGDRVENFGFCGFHPRALARRQNDDHDLSIIHR